LDLPSFTSTSLYVNLRADFKQGEVMKKLMLSSLLLLSLTAQAKELSAFTDIANAVGQGAKLTFVMNFKNCISEIPLPNIIASYKPEAVMVVGDTRITASYRHFSLDDPSARGIPTYSYQKYDIDNGGNAHIKVTVMNAANYDKLSTFQINCHLGEGFKIYS